MADLQPQIKSRQEVWRELGSQQYDTPSDLYQPEKPVVLDNATPKVGIREAFIKGVPTNRDSGFEFNPSYEPTLGETLASTVTDFARSGAAVLAEWTPEYKTARASLDKLRQTDPEAADQIEEASIGKKLSNSKLAIKGAAAVGEAALTIAPWFKFGRAGLVVAETGLLNKTGVVGTKIASSPTLQRLYSGGLNGFLYGGLYGLHAYDADWKEAVKSSALGAGFGIGAVGGISGLAFLGRYGGNKALEGFKFTGDVVGDIRKKVGIPTLAEALPQNWYANIFGVGSTIKKYYGDVGENFLRMYKNASRVATKDLGNIQLAFIDNGLMKPPTGFGKAFKGVEFVGDDIERMSYYNQVLKGLGAYSNKEARTAAIAADSKLQFLDGLRKDYYVKAKDVGLFKVGLDPETYLPKHTPIIELSSTARTKLASAATPAEREVIYAANDAMVKEMVDNSVKYDKSFKSLDEAYATYYDYADAVRGGSHTPMGDNKMLQKMVADGKASNIEEARGKIISDLKMLKQSLTPDAASLDFEREVDLPWYDPNPARVMQQYTMDASMRIEMARTFGVNDQKIKEMIGSIKSSFNGEISADEAAVSFEKLVRTVTGQIFETQKEQRFSAALRALQIPKLAFAQIMNLGQSLNTLLASDLGSTMHGLTTAFTVPEIRNAIERGVLMNQFVRQIFDFNGAGGGGKFTDAMLKYNGFTFTEMFNRVVGSSASDVWAEKNLTKLLSLPENKMKLSNEYAALRELGLDVDVIIKRGSFLPEDKAIAAQTFVETTQFLAHAYDLPAFASSSYGKVLFQFKTFTYQQARFVTNQLKNSFGRGDYKRGFRNLFILSTVFPMTGEILADVRSLITQEKRPTKFLDRYISDIFSAGTYGLFYDFYTSTLAGKSLESLAGPTLSDATKYLELVARAPGQITKGHGKTTLTNFSKQLLRQTGFGRVIVNSVYPSSYQGKTTLKSLIDWSAE